MSRPFGFLPANVVNISTNDSTDRQYWLPRCIVIDLIERYVEWRNCSWSRLKFCLNFLLISDRKYGKRNCKWIPSNRRSSNTYRHVSKRQEQINYRTGTNQISVVALSTTHSWHKLHFYKKKIKCCKMFLISVMLRWHSGIKNHEIWTFKVNFLWQKTSKSLFFSLKNINLGPPFL